MSQYKYAKPSVTTDIICYTQHKDVLFIRRKNEPFKHMFALPGGFVDIILDDEIVNGAIRELKEETNIIRNKNQLYQFKTYGSKKRDPREYTITVVYYTLIIKTDKIKAADDAASHLFIHIDDIKKEHIAFDHFEIVKEFFKGAKR